MSVHSVWVIFSHLVFRYLGQWYSALLGFWTLSFVHCSERTNFCLHVQVKGEGGTSSGFTRKTNLSLFQILNNEQRPETQQS
jgi:hypothetical protein